jgi:DNA-directed RNA polymerase specialized sigma24 family protein
MHDSERDRIFGDWLAGHKGILFKVVHAYAFDHAEQLKDVDRSVALLLLDGFSYKEIAAIVGITESNVGVKISRIKSALAGKRAEEEES